MSSKVDIKNISFQFLFSKVDATCSACGTHAAICLKAFMQTTLLFLGLISFPNNMLLSLGIMLVANEEPRIAQQFCLDSFVNVNMMSVVHNHHRRQSDAQRSQSSRKVTFL